MWFHPFTNISSLSIMRTLVMGDIHGAHKALLQCLERSNFNHMRDSLIQLGDVTDRWPEVYEVIETLLKIDNEGKLIALKGNHDDWLLNFIDTGKHPKKWAHGGKDTISSYGNRIAQSVKNVSQGDGYKTSFSVNDIPYNHQEFFRKQLTHYIDSENNCFVHGGFNAHLSFANQDKNHFYWDRELWAQAMSLEVFHENPSEALFLQTTFREIFIGHTPTTQWGTDQPMHAANIWNLDTGAGCNGRLTIMDVSTKQFWQSDLVSVLYV